MRSIDSLKLVPMNDIFIKLSSGVLRRFHMRPSASSRDAGRSTAQEAHG